MSTMHHRAIQAAIAASLLGASLALAESPAPTAELVARNDLSERHAIDERNPEASVPTPEQAMKNPLEMGYLLMDLIARAEAAAQRGDHPAAVRYHRAIVKAVPERALAHANLCKAYEALGDRPHALASCKRALGLKGVQVEHYVRYARLVLAGEGELPPSDREDVAAIIAHLEKELAGQPEARLTAVHLSCELATRLDDAAGLERCTNQLVSAAPDDARTVTFQWALALAQQDLEAARDVVAHARSLGLPAAVLDDMESKLALEQERASGVLAALRRHGPLALIALLTALGFIILRRSWSGRIVPGDDARRDGRQGRHEPAKQ